ncbi:MAG: hypothetical protein AAGC74_06610 [Verrucomicrobiota bacterium]
MRRPFQKSLRLLTNFRLLFAIITLLGCGILLWNFFTVFAAAKANEIDRSEIIETETLLKHFVSDIEVERAFRASKYGGIHGDGTAVEVYLFEPKFSNELQASLAIHHRKRDPSFTWQEVNRADLHGIERLLPPEFRPKGTKFIQSKSQQSNHLSIIAHEEGQYFSLSSRT